MWTAFEPVEQPLWGIPRHSGSIDPGAAIGQNSTFRSADLAAALVASYEYIQR